MCYAYACTATCASIAIYNTCIDNCVQECLKFPALGCQCFFMHLYQLLLYYGRIRYTYLLNPVNMIMNGGNEMKFSELEISIAFLSSTTCTCQQISNKMTVINTQQISCNQEFIICCSKREYQGLNIPCTNTLPLVHL